MRRPITALLLLALALCLVPRVAAQDAQKILDQYKKAVGGGKTLDHLQTLSLDGTIRAEADQNPGTYTFKVKQPNRYYVEIRKEGKTLIEAYNGKSSWHQTENGTIATLLGDEALQMDAAGQYYNTRLVALSKKKIGAAYKGTTQVRGHEAQQVTLTFPTGVQWDVYFDPQSHLIVEEKATIAGIPQEIYYGDYRSVNGLKAPYKIELHRGSEVYDVNLTQAVANETVGERVFDFPKKSQVQLPDLKKLFEEIDANQKQIDKIKENYAATRVEEETEYDKTGTVTKKDVKE
jgi:outer membrane lipoprotein-sorting protein